MVRWSSGLSAEALPAGSLVTLQMVDLTVGKALNNLKSMGAIF